jgi:hypothetical protein
MRGASTVDALHMYFDLIHVMGGVNGADRKMAVAQRFLSNVGITIERKTGRTQNLDAARVLKRHAVIVRRAGGSNGHLTAAR